MRLLPAAALVCLAFSPLAARAASPWDGTWALDRAHSKLTGETYTYTRLPDGTLEYSNGADLKVVAKTDGTEFNGPYPGTTGTWKTTSPTTADFDQKLNGRLIASTHLVLSADGKTLTSNRTSYRPDGTTGASTSTATRTAGTGTGFEGTWQRSSLKSSTPDIFVALCPTPDSMHLTNPAYKDSWQGKLDGTEAPFEGPAEIQGMTYALKATSDHTLDGTTRLNGKPISYEQDTLSADGKTWTIVTWDSGKDTEKSTYVYLKQ